MATILRLTIPESVASIERQFGQKVPVWKLRRIVDSMETAGALNVQRIGNYRTVSNDDIAAIAVELVRIGWLEVGAIKC